jgi:hypothetical protein
MFGVGEITNLINEIGADILTRICNLAVNIRNLLFTFAAVFLVVAAIYFLLGAGDPESIRKGKEKLMLVVIAFFVAYLLLRILVGIIRTFAPNYVWCPQF